MYSSGLYWRFIGIAQFITGCLLITQRYAKLGAILFLPIIANVFVITISYNFNGTPFITGLMLLSTLFLIYWDWNTFKILFNKKPIITNTKRLENDSLWMYIGIIYISITILLKVFFLNKYIIFGFLFMVLIGLIGMVVGFKRSKLYR